MWILQLVQWFTIPSMYNVTSGAIPNVWLTTPQNEALSFIRNKTNISIEELKSPNLGQPEAERRAPNRRLLARIRTLRDVEQCQSQMLERLRLEKRNANRKMLPSMVMSRIEDQQKIIEKQRHVMRVQLENLEKLQEARQPFWDPALGAFELMSSSSEVEEVEIITASTPDDVIVREGHVDQADFSTLSQYADPSSMSTGSTASTRSSCSSPNVAMIVDDQNPDSQAQALKVLKKVAENRVDLQITSSKPKKIEDSGDLGSRSLFCKKKKDQRIELGQHTPTMNAKTDSTNFRNTQKSESAKFVSNQVETIETDWESVVRKKFDAQIRAQSPVTPPTSGESSELSDSENPNLNDVDEITCRFIERTVSGVKNNPNSSRSARRSPRAKLFRDGKIRNERSEFGRQPEKLQIRGTISRSRKNTNSARNIGNVGSVKQSPITRSSRVPAHRDFHRKRFTERRPTLNKDGCKRDLKSRQAVRALEYQDQAILRPGQKSPIAARQKVQSVNITRSFGQRKHSQEFPQSRENLCTISHESKLKEDQLRNDELLARQLSQDEWLARQIQREEFIARFQYLQADRNFDPSHFADICMMQDTKDQDKKEDLPHKDIEIVEEKKDSKFQPS